LIDGFATLPICWPRPSLCRRFSPIEHLLSTAPITILIFLDKISSALNNHAEIKEKNTTYTDFSEESGKKKRKESIEWVAI
jgi:hypothetical protein